MEILLLYLLVYKELYFLGIHYIFGILKFYKGQLPMQNKYVCMDISWYKLSLSV